MSALAFMQFWQAVPFRPFRVRLSDGRAFEVMRAQQVAGSPDLRQFVVMVEGGPVAFGPELVSACEVLESSDPSSGSPYALDEDALAQLRAAGVDPAAISVYKPNAGNLSLMGYSTTDWLRLVQFAIGGRGEGPLLSTLATRWDLVGVESFENGRTLYLVHADDPLLQKRVIVWPPDRATFESFAEAAPIAEIQRQLMAMDEAAQANPGEVRAAEGYLESVKRGEPGVPPVEPASEPAADQFKAETRAVEVGPHRYADEVRLAPVRGGSPVFDLFETGWYGTAEPDSGAWRVQVCRGTEAGAMVRVRVRPGPKIATVEGGGTYPIWFVEPLLRNYGLYDDRAALDRALRAGPRPHTEPQVSVPLAHGYLLEMWPGEPSIATPFLHPRLLEPGGRAILDLRGTAWGSFVDRDLARSDAVRLRLINRDGPDRGRFEMARYRLQVDLPGRRVTSPDIAGSTSLGGLHVAAHASRVATMLASKLEEMMTRGKGLG